MTEETKRVRLLFVCACGVNITGKPSEAKADVQIHREHCQTCSRVNYVNTLEISDRQNVKRELVIPADQMDVTMNMIILHDAVIPPWYIVKKAITGVLPASEDRPDMKVLPIW